MKFLYIILLLSFNIFASENIPVKQKPQYMLESISKHAIRIGTGTLSNVYIFVDPMCKYSRRIMSRINENQMLQLKSSYYIFLYRLPKFDSDKLIQYIYQSSDQKSVIMDVMVDEEIIDLDDFKADKETLQALKNIAKVAKKLDMKLRPYIITFDKGSKYCRVSEGIVSCLEEF